MEILSTIILVVVALYIGWYVRGIVILANLSENPDRVIRMLEEIKKLNEKERAKSGKIENLEGDELVIERVGNQLYAFTKDNDEFIAQGPDLKTLLETANKRFPNRTFFGNISRDNDAKELAVKS